MSASDRGTPRFGLAIMACIYEVLLDTCKIDEVWDVSILHRLCNPSNRNLKGREIH